MVNRAQLFEEKSKLLSEQVRLEQNIAFQNEQVKQAENVLSKVQSKLEEEIKKSSINDISDRAIIMLDRLQQILYHRQIEKVEAVFKEEINVLMRKANFIDSISIDDNFNVHIYRKKPFTLKALSNLIEENTEEFVFNLLGSKAVTEIKAFAKTVTLKEAVTFFKRHKDDEIIVSIEIDKDSLSNGEKQIFIMALYHSLISLCNHEIPFIIDTPFARIDTEHRINISKFFFSKLKGQVFILSTNEEVDAEHVSILKEKLASTYMLENSDNKQTFIVKNTYFEV